MISEWHSIASLSRFFAKSERLIRRWCVDGTFQSANIPVYKDKRGRWWAALPSEGSIACRNRVN